MGGEVNWGALETVSEILGIEDVERLILFLGEIRDDHAARQAAR